jgi:hypothetical protein
VAIKPKVKRTAKPKKICAYIKKRIIFREEKYDKNNEARTNRPKRIMKLGHDFLY